MATQPGSSSSSSDKKMDRLARLKNLQLKRNEARKMNHQEVVEEDRRNKLPTNHEQKRKRVEWELEETTKRQVAEEAGDDYDRVKLLEIGAEEQERWDKKKKKMNPDPGFSDYDAATQRLYQKNTKQLRHNPESYQQEKEKMGDAFYAGVNTLGVGEHKDSEENIDKMVGDLQKQIDKRGKYSRRRAHDEEADIDYINERNMKFNKKLERFYGGYTAEIKQNLERGTAV